MRDLVLRRSAVDLDLVTEGDSLELAEAVAARTGGDVKVYGRFATTCVLSGRSRIDIAKARTESYSRPGALPDVQPGPLQDDLARRDFTINAMALGLAGTHKGLLLDPEGGMADLEAGIIRVIHDGSFVDDSTRILRGLRYSARLWFSIEPETARLMRSQASYLESISGSRLRTELHFLLGDVRPWRSLEQAGSLGVLGALVNGLGWDQDRSAVARTLTGLRPTERSSQLLVLLASTLTARGVEELITRISLGVRESRLARQSTRFAQRVSEAEGRASVELALSLSDVEPSVISAMSALLLEPNDAARLAAMIRARPRLRGDDLMALGLDEGPAIGLVLAELRRAAMAGTVTTRDDELALARKLIDSLSRDKQDS